ncbi:four helix bundle protein [Chryseobacterium sp. KMC2]|uniref:four helix bundle protein n=1 Tax=Chryseobacterium sp. KMC2 TaxID=2800705 RepID=UPI00293D54C0|nr:four helix bundle protein [Chryseobacterium sp. KMC2]
MTSQNLSQKKNTIPLRIRSEDHQDPFSANISEAWGKRKYERSFIAKLTDSEGEARETQTWLQFALACEYINTEEFGKLNNEYNQIIGMLVIMMGQSEKWCSFSSLDTEQKD